MYHEGGEREDLDGEEDLERLEHIEGFGTIKKGNRERAEEIRKRLGMPSGLPEDEQRRRNARQKPWLPN